MPLPPQKFREAAFQILFMSDFSSLDGDVIPFMMNELKTTRKEVVQAVSKVESVLSHKVDIDALIEKYSEGYSFERITRSEKVILRLGVFELVFEKKVPAKVAIAEGIRLCRKFGTKESSLFVNAVLDKVHKTLGESLDANPLAEESAPC